MQSFHGFLFAACALTGGIFIPSLSYARPASIETVDIGPEDIVYHRALYRIELTERSSSASVLNLTGRMFYAWQHDCEAWQTDQRFDLRYEYAESPPITVTSDFSTYESFDGKDLHFSSRRSRNGKIYEEFRGHAHAPENKAGRVAFTTPPDLTFDLPQGAVFPVGHTLTLLRKLKHAPATYNASIFDGSDEEGAVEINAVIIPPENNEKHKTVAPLLVSEEKNLLESPSRRIHMAFFPDDSAESLPDYEMIMRLHQNGLISEIETNYHDFTVRHELVALEPLPQPTCP